MSTLKLSLMNFVRNICFEIAELFMKIALSFKDSPEKTVEEKDKGEQMEKVIISEIPLDGSNKGRPIAKGEVIENTPAFAVVEIQATATNYPGSDLIRGIQKFNKEFYDVHIV